jgi:predicted ATP-binding protein involved in virulence
MPDRKTKKAPRKAARKNGRPSPTTGSYFLSLELENVRCFSERQTLDLSDGNGRPARWTILLGENGTGKTTILQLLAALEPIPVRVQGQESPAYLHRFTLMEPRTSFLRSVGEAVAVVRFAERAGLDRDSLSLESRIEFAETYFGSRSMGGSNPLFPLCFGYGAGRRSSNSSIDRSGSRDPAGSLFFDNAELINAEEWLLQLDYSVSKRSEVQEQQKQRLEMVKKVLIDVLLDVTDIRFDASSGFKPAPKVEFETPYGWVPLRQLGYGYRTMIAWVVDFAARMVERYPDSSDPLAEPAVVLVDEIDLHLHPKWQREVIGYLTERFPNTQFIVTSHSPLIVQAAAGANIALLKREGDHVVIENHPETIRGWRIDQVLTSDLFGLETARPPDEEKLLLRRKELLTKPRKSKAEREELEQIEEKLGPIPTGESFEQAKTMALIQDSIEFLKKSQGPKP